MDFVIKRFDELTPREVYEILRARAEVFVKEQGIICADPDGVDYDAYHVFAVEEGRVTAYLRAYGVGEGAVKIGRVLTLRRGRGEGSALMRFAMDALQERVGCTRFLLDAQLPVVGFYEKLGFEVTSGEYLEEGVRHVDMCCTRAAPTGLR